MKKVAMVVQRCHPSVVGGSESLAWQYAEILKHRYEVDILTTTSIDSITWENVIPAGIEEMNGITIRRFYIDIRRTSYWLSLQKRLLEEFLRKQNPHSSKGYWTKWTLAMQEEWIRHQGPFSRELLRFIQEHNRVYHTIIFLTYLFPTTYFGIQLCSRDRCILVPTLHDEPPAYLPAFKYMSRRARFCLWNTLEEKNLGHRLWGDIPGCIIGMWINTKKYEPMILSHPYLLYSGRISQAKGCLQLIDFFSKYKKLNQSDIRLVLTGKDEMNLEGIPDIEYRGFVSEEEKFQLMAGAVAFVNPSPFESFSVVALEALAQETTVIANGSSRVLDDHIKRSGGGEVYLNYEDFETVLNKIITDPNHRKQYGLLGRKYVIENYAYAKIQEKLERKIESYDALF